MMLLKEAYSDFILSLRADGLSPATVEWYAALLSDYAHSDDGIDSISGRDIRLYIVGKRSKLTPSSVDGYVRALGRFWRWVADEYGMDCPMPKIRLSKPEPRPRGISPETLRAMWHATSKGKGIARLSGLRDRALLAFLADTGARAAGVCGLRVDDCDYRQRYALIIEKGDKRRRVPFTQFTAVCIEAWLDARPWDHPLVFTGVRAPHLPLNRFSLRDLLDRLADRGGVADERHNAHSFRHGFARHYLSQGGDLVTLARLLGHASIETTAHYYAVFSSSELSEKHDELSQIRRIAENQKEAYSKGNPLNKPLSD